MPFAISSGKAASVEYDRWTCMSQSPGIRNLPEPSITRARRGSLTAPDLPSEVILSPEMTTVMSDCGGRPVASITVTRVKTSEGRGCSRGCWASDLPGASRTSRRGSRNHAEDRFTFPEYAPCPQCTQMRVVRLTPASAASGYTGSSSAAYEGWTQGDELAGASFLAHRFDLGAAEPAM